MSEHVPSVERAWELMERAWSDPGALKVLGWAHSSVMHVEASALNFTVYDRLQRGAIDQEDHVIIVAVRVPHPDEMSLADVIGVPEGG